jgi:Ran GTPase-activating protein (RanGAP) involved in mRNA processing and transport
MASNYITSNVTTLLTDYLAADPQMKWLDLQGNNLTDNDAELLANALRSNTTLRYLDLGLFNKDRTITNVYRR